MLREFTVFSDDVRIGEPGLQLIGIGIESTLSLTVVLMTDSMRKPFESHFLPDQLVSEEVTSAPLIEMAKSAVRSHGNSEAPSKFTSMFA